VILFLALACLGGAIFYATEIASVPARERRKLIERASKYGEARKFSVGIETVRFRERVVGPLAARISRLVLRINPKQTVEGVSRQLLAAGMRRVSPHAFIATRALLGIGGAVFGLVVGGAASPGLGMFFALGAGALGYVAPGIVLNSRARRRQSQIVAELPDALDLLSVSVEAGMGFDGAVAKLVQYMEGPLIDEFNLALGEMRIGESRVEALKKMADRVDAHELSAFVRALVQADQLGTSLGRMLRVQATDTRLKRQMAAEEKAMKAPIKMLFPTAGFIFPSMFIIILGPAALSITKIFH
jgi:tight adherence protein C